MTNMLTGADGGSVPVQMPCGRFCSRVELGSWYSDHRHRRSYWHHSLLRGLSSQEEGTSHGQWRTRQDGPVSDTHAQNGFPLAHCHPAVGLGSRNLRHRRQVSRIKIHFKEYIPTVNFTCIVYHFLSNPGGDKL